MLKPMKYSGSCHCGAVRFTVDADLAQTGTCNCSHCGRKGFILAFVPAAAFTLEAGADAQTEYRFNTKKIQHLFCKTCGVQSFARGENPDGTPTVMVNVRCLDGVAVETLTPQHYNGKEF
jgi:hypothetical protein